MPSLTKCDDLPRILFYQLVQQSPAAFFVMMKTNVMQIICDVDAINIYFKKVIWGFGLHFNFEYDDIVQLLPNLAN